MPFFSRRHILPLTLVSLMLGLLTPKASRARVASSQPKTSADLQELVEELLDREAIRELPIAYCHFIWKGDAEGAVGLFARNGRIKVPANLAADGDVVGTEALRAFYRRGVAGAVAGIDPRPFVHNHYVELLGNGRAKGHVYAEIRNGQQGFRVTQIAVYEDSYVKENGSWKFEERKFVITPLPG